MTYSLFWRVRSNLRERFGQRCRVICYGLRMNTALVEFDDGYRAVTMKWFASDTAPATAAQRSLF